MATRGPQEGAELGDEGATEDTGIAQTVPGSGPAGVHEHASPESDEDVGREAAPAAMARTQTPHFYTEFAARTLGRGGNPVSDRNFEGTPSAGDESFMRSVEEEVDRDEAETESELLRLEATLSGSELAIPQSPTGHVANESGSSGGRRVDQQNAEVSFADLRAAAAVGSRGFQWLTTDAAMHAREEDLPVAIIEEEILNLALGWLPDGEQAARLAASFAAQPSVSPPTAESDLTATQAAIAAPNLSIDKSPGPPSLGSTAPGFVTEFVAAEDEAASARGAAPSADGGAQVETIDDGGMGVEVAEEVAASREEGQQLLGELFGLLAAEGFESIAALTHLLDQPLGQRLALYRLTLPDPEEEGDEATQLVHAWLEEGAAMCVQRAVRMHAARRTMRARVEREQGRQAVDHRRETQRFVEELMEAEDEVEAHELALHGLQLWRVLPQEEREYLASVVQESEAPGARAMRSMSVRVIQTAARGFLARARVRRRRAMMAAGDDASKLEETGGAVDALDGSAEHSLAHTASSSLGSTASGVVRLGADGEGQREQDGGREPVEHEEGEGGEGADSRIFGLIREGMEVLAVLPTSEPAKLEAMIAASEGEGEGAEMDEMEAAAVRSLRVLVDKARTLWGEVGEEEAVAQVMRLGAAMSEADARVLQSMVDLVVGPGGEEGGFGLATLASLGTTKEAAGETTRLEGTGATQRKEAEEEGEQAVEEERELLKEDGEGDGEAAEAARREEGLKAMAGWTADALREEVERREAQRVEAVQAATHAEKVWSDVIEGGAAREVVKAADAEAKAARGMANSLRFEIDELHAMLEQAQAREEAAGEGAARESREGSRGGRQTVPRWARSPERAATGDGVGAAIEQRMREMRSMEEREADLRKSQELRTKKDAQAKRRKAHADAAKQAKLVVERTELARHTLKLDYSCLSLTSIPPVVFTDSLLRHVKILWLNENDIEELPPELGTLRELTQLRVFKNKLTQLPPEIGELTALQILWVQDNLLTTLPPEIEKLSSLTLLSLTGNPLRVLPVELSRLSKVREMELSTNHVTFPPPSISRAGTRKVLDFLRRADRAWRTSVLDLSDMDMDIIPLDIISLFPSLTRLYIDANEITRFPFEFCAMTRLVEIRFDRDKMLSPSIEIWDQGITRVMEFMGKFITYRTDPRVDLKAWGLRSIPDEITDPGLVTRVTLLDFSDNKLTHVPHDVGHMTSLTDLRLDQNQLEKLPQSICWLSNITTLSVTVNRLKSFPDHMRHMECLQFLHLDSNELEALPVSLPLATRLEQVTVCSNRIRELPEGIAALTNLRVLAIADNYLERIPFEFGACTFLDALEVDGNPIWSPPSDIMQQDQMVWFAYLHRLTASLDTQQRTVAGKPVQGGVLELPSFALTEFPPELQRMPHLFHHLIDMNFDHNQLSSLPKSMAKMTNLTSLTFSRNCFRVCPQILGRCYNVTELNFEKNLLTFLPMEIGNLTALRKLRVEGNKLTQPPMEVVKMGIAFVIRFLKVFAAASSSGEVVMSGCDLRAFPLAVADLDHLQKLDLSHNYIGRMPNEFLVNKTVSFVDMSYNDLTVVEPGIHDLDNLQTLMLSGNRIRVIPDAIFQLTKLHTLVINQNELTEIPAGLGVMTWLKVLKASNNQIETLPLEIGRMVSLKKLNLSYNFIDSMPTTIGNLTSMQELNIAQNEIHMLPPIMGIMANLREVYLIENPLSKHPPEVVTATMATQQTTHLWHDGEHPGNPLSMWLARIRRARITKDMDAAHFNLNTMPTQVLQATSLHLIHLRMEHNMIKVVPPEIAALSSLTLLNLSHNKIKAVPSTIGTMTNLTVLSLNNNKISRLPIEIGHLSGTTMKRLAIAHNRLETPPKEFMTASSAHLLKYFATSEIAMLSGTLDWSWCHAMVTMRRVCDEVVNWEQLVHVNLDDNEITLIDWKMCLAMTQLETLELRRNRIVEIPKQISAHSSLRVLALSQNRITTLPIDLGSMRNLVNLQVHGMTLNLPPRSVLFYGTQNVLAYLNAIRYAEQDGRCILNHFDLSEIPKEVLGLVDITVLELDCMKISDIPEAIVGLTNLARLTFNHNLVEDLPVCVSELTNLTELELSHNQVTALLPEHFVLTNLAWLNIDFNPIKTPPKEVLDLIMSKFARVETPLATPLASMFSRRTPSAVDSVDGDGPASTLGTPVSFARVPSTAPTPFGRVSSAQSTTPLSALPHRRGVESSAPINSSPGTALASVTSGPLASAGGASGLDDRSLASEEDGGRPRPDRVLQFLRALMVARLENVLDIEGFGLNGWPKEASNTPAITSMNLNNNRLKQIPPDIKALSCLTYLSADYNQIRTISTEISFLTNLVELRLSHNKIQTIPACFSEFKALTLLSMTHNAIAVLPTELFQCTSLEILQLDFNMVTELPPELAELRKLVTLSYAKNPVIIPPEEIREHGHQEILRFYERILNSAPACNIKGMECDALSASLNLDEFHLRFVPNVVYRGLPRPGGTWDEQKPRRDRWAQGMTHLTDLSLNSNFLTEIPELLPRLELLEELKVRNNSITKLPSALGKMYTLFRLDLRQNKVEELPSTVSKLTCLKYLLLDDNLITSLPNGLGELPELLNLEIRNNRLIDLPIDLCKTKSIKVLALENNPVRMPSQEVIDRGMRAIIDFLSRLYRCQETHTLDLRALGLQSIDYEILPIPTLKRLLIANNKVTVISAADAEDDGSKQDKKDKREAALRRRSSVRSNVLTSLKHGVVEEEIQKGKLNNLEYLNADHNLLSKLPSSITTLTSLTELSLQSNRIEELPYGLPVLTNLTRLSVAHNPITKLPLDLGLMRTSLRKLDIDIERLTMPPIEVSRGGLPIIMRYLADLTSARTSRYLELMGMQLESIPSEITDITVLQRLLLDSNNISELPLRLCTLVSLTELWVSKNKIRRLPREICEALTNLKSLRVNENSLAVLPMQIGRMSNLTDLRVHDNQITILPLEMGDLQHLQNVQLDVPDMVSPYPEVCERGAKVIVAYLLAIRTARETKCVDLRALGLSTFPVEVYTLPSITALHLDDNSITMLPPSIERLSDLQELTLNNLQLQSLPFVMGAMTSLTSLRLTASRRMTSPPYEIVVQGTDVLLTYLRKSFVCVRKTGYMNLSNMSLESLPKEVLALNNLQHLQARNNHILHLSTHLGKMNSIVRMHLHNNGLLYLPREVGLLVTLQELRLPSNRLRVLPDELGGCFDLRKLSAQSNLLSTIPEAVFSGVTRLISLNVSHNQVLFLPDTLGALHKLEKLRMGQNQMRYLPETIGKCTSLTLLSLTCNQLWTIPDTFANCSNVTALHMSSNRFRQLPRCVDGLMRLRLLWAANNELIGLPTSLARLPDLCELQVKGNADLRYPPVDVVTEGREAIVAYLVANMRYEDSEENANKQIQMASMAEARAKDDEEAAELARSLVEPLAALAKSAAADAELAEQEAMEKRAKTNVYKTFDLFEAVETDGSLTETEKDKKLRELRDQKEEDEMASAKAEDVASKLRAEATAASARAKEAVLIADALSVIADTSGRTAQQLRIDADAQEAIIIRG